MLESKLLSENENMKDLLRVVTIVLILSHGQARVESGFSVNEKVSRKSE